MFLCSSVLLLNVCVGSRSFRSWWVVIVLRAWVEFQLNFSLASSPLIQEASSPIKTDEEAQAFNLCRVVLIYREKVKVAKGISVVRPGYCWKDWSCGHVGTVPASGYVLRFRFLWSCMQSAVTALESWPVCFILGPLLWSISVLGCYWVLVSVFKRSNNLKLVSQTG